MSKLTEVQIRNAKPHPERLRMLGDGSGLWLRVYPTGAKAWLLRRAVNGRLRTVTLGVYDEMTLKQARVAAYERRKQSTSAAIPRTVAELAQTFYATEIEGHHRRPKDTWQYLERDLKPLWKKKVSDVERADLSAILASKRGQGRVAANRLLTIIKRCFSHAFKLGWIDSDPAALLDRSVAGGKEKPRERVLTDDEIKKLWAATEGVGLGNLVRFLLVGGQRITETQLARWDEIDLQKRVWSIPAERTKSHRAHWVSLPPLAVDVLNALPRSDNNVFRNRTANGTQTWLREFCKREAIVPAFTPHDLRRTVATRMNELGVAPHVVEKIMNHAMAGVMRIYNRAQYEAERIEGQAKWAKSLSVLVATPI